MRVPLGIVSAILLFVSLVSAAAGSVCIDNTNPVILEYVPANNSYINTQTPLIAANYTDSPCGINESLTQLIVDGVNRTLESTITNTSIEYTPATPLSEAVHTVQLIISDLAGNTAQAIWNFIVDITAPVISFSPTNGFDQYDGVLSNSAPNNTITITFNENVSIVSATVDGNPITLIGSGTTYEYNVTEATDVPHNLTVIAEDLAGNQVTGSYNYLILPETRADVIGDFNFGVMRNGMSKQLIDVVEIVNTGYGDIAVAISSIENCDTGLQDTASIFYKDNMLFSDDSGANWYAWNVISTTIYQNATFNASKKISASLTIPVTNTLEGNVTSCIYFTAMPAP